VKIFHIDTLSIYGKNLQKILYLKQKTAFAAFNILLTCYE